MNDIPPPKLGDLILSSLFAMQTFTRQLSCPAIRRVLHDGAPRPRTFQCLYATSPRPRNRNLFSTNAALLQQETLPNPQLAKDVQPAQNRKPARNPPGKNSLRRVAAEAQRSREATQRKKDAAVGETGSNRVTAVSVADQFDMDAVVGILRSHGFLIDPDSTGFDNDQVIHTRGVNNGDIFVFPSGSLVAWSLPEDVVSDLATKTLLPAAINPHMDQMEMEDLEYTEDSKRENSSIRGDVITIGTKTSQGADEQAKYVHLGFLPFTLREFVSNIFP